MVCPGTLVTTVTAAAIAMAEGRSTDEIDLLGSVFTQLGDTLATISAQRSAIEAKCEKSKKSEESGGG